ncbi:hypothetical protein [Streptomyces erythrochromogenes]|uniref:hypothetical protein n=1 Tax=Streptomyces erythrochromogenes TaxID=285574 RepID=UPI0036957E45
MTTPWEWAGNLSAVLSAGHALGAIWYQPWAVTLRRRASARPPRRRAVETEPGPGRAPTVHITVQVPADTVFTVEVVTVPGKPGSRGGGAGR